MCSKTYETVSTIVYLVNNIN